MTEDIARRIREGRTALGIEFGSTRIKAVLTDEDCRVLATGSHDWENRFEDGNWTYSEEDIREGVRDCFAKTVRAAREKYGAAPEKIGAIGVSAMMHGYIALDAEGNLLVPFRTWRNNSAAAAAEELTRLFGSPIPARWSAAHLYRAIKEGEPHLAKIDYLTTLAGYVHRKLTGKRVVGVGEASGMFPVEGASRRYDEKALEKFDRLVEGKGLPFKNVREILPDILLAGDDAGRLTEEGARYLDPTGGLRAGALLCPPEGDAGTGMVATNSVRPRTGNVSAGTSVFAMIVLEKNLSRVHPEIDLVTTPVGDPVAMVHCNNCTSDLNGWVDLFGDFARRAGLKLSKAELYDLLYESSLEGDKDCGGLLAYNYVSNEHITRVDAGRPLFVRTSKSAFNLPNFFRAHLFSALGALKTGCDILLKEEKVRLDKITGHGGLFKTERVGQSYLAAALNTPVTVMKTAGEGGAWGIAVLANYALCREAGETLEDYLDGRVFAGQEGITLAPDPADVAGFEAFAARYVRGLPVVREAVERVEERE